MISKSKRDDVWNGKAQRAGGQRAGQEGTRGVSNRQLERAQIKRSQVTAWEILLVATTD